MIIGISGLISSGKDTVANFLIEKGFAKGSFADSLKDSVSAIFGWDREMLQGDTVESRDWRETVDDWWSIKLGEPTTPRSVLQKFGTDVCRNHFHSDIWLLSLEKKILENERNNVNTVISDVRFRNEIAMIQKLNGKIFNVKRGPEPPWWFEAVLAFEATTDDVREHHADKLRYHYNLHETEWDWVGHKFDTVIQNDGTLDDLKEKALNVLAKYEFFGKDI